MSKQRRSSARHQPAPPPRRPWRTLAVGGTAVVAVAVIALAALLNAGGRATAGIIDEHTSLDAFRDQVRWNDLYWLLAQSLR